MILVHSCVCQWPAVIFREPHQYLKPNEFKVQFLVLQYLVSLKNHRFVKIYRYKNTEGCGVYGILNTLYSMFTVDLMQHVS